MLVAFSLMLSAAQPAQAQNLVQDPDFSAGLTYYQSPYGFSSGGVTATTYDGMTGVQLSGSAYAYVEQYPIVGYTSGVTYAFTFLVAAINPDQPTTIYAGFSPTCSGECQGASLQQTTSSSTLTQFSLNGTASNSSGSYFYIEAGGGDAFVTGLDLEPAPAPIPGAGIMSFTILLAGLAFRRMRARQSG